MNDLEAILFDLGGAFGEISRDSDDPRSLLPPKKLVPNDAPNHSKNRSPSERSSTFNCSKFPRTGVFTILSVPSLRLMSCTDIRHTSNEHMAAAAR